jgi:hypothetical protein
MYASSSAADSCTISGNDISLLDEDDIVNAMLKVSTVAVGGCVAFGLIPMSVASRADCQANNPSGGKKSEYQTKKEAVKVALRQNSPGIVPRGF